MLVRPYLTHRLLRVWARTVLRCTVKKKSFGGWQHVKLQCWSIFLHATFVEDMNATVSTSHLPSTILSFICAHVRVVLVMFCLSTVSCSLYNHLQRPWSSFWVMTLRICFESICHTSWGFFFPFCSQEGSVNRSLFSLLYMCDYMPDEGDNVYC